MYSSPFFVPSSSSLTNLNRGRIPKAVSLYEVVPLGLVLVFAINYLNNEETVRRLTRSPSRRVVRKIISGIKERKKPNTLFLSAFFDRYLLYALVSLVCCLVILVVYQIFNRIPNKLIQQGAKHEPFDKKKK